MVRKVASIGANATVVCGNEFGEYVFIGAGMEVTKDVPAYALVVGHPASQTGWISKHGISCNLIRKGRLIAKKSDDTLKKDSVRKK